MAIRITSIFPTVLNTISANLNSVIAGISSVISYLGYIWGKVALLTYDTVRNHSVIVIDETHTYIHDKDGSSCNGYYVASTEIERIGAGTTIDWILITTDRRHNVHFTFSLKTSPRNTAEVPHGILRFFEQCEGDGDRLLSFDRNRERQLLAYTTLKTNLVHVSTGTEIYKEFFGISAGIDEHHHDKKEFVLKPGVKYLLRFENLTEQDILAQLVMNFYEPQRE